MILCCGEALIDMIPGTDLEGRKAFVPCMGGASLNSAIALGRLGAQVGLVSGVSRDQFGEMLCDAMRENSVDTQFLVRSDRLTTLAMVFLKDGSATYQFYDDNSAGRMIQPADMPALPSNVTALMFGGISLAMDPAADAYAHLLETEGAGRVVMLDPNIRPGFIADEARYRARLDRMLAQSDIVKVSDEDLDWMIPGAQSHAEKLQILLTKGPSLVLMTLGAKGAEAYWKGDVVSVPAQPAKVVDTVGAGDTFNAGFLAKLQELGALTRDGFQNLDASQLQAALSLGTRAAAVTVARAGANPPWAAELDA